MTWADVPDTNITESSVTQHQDALSIGESQITFTSSFIEAGDLSVGADAAASGSGGLGYNDSTGVFTYTPPDLSLTLSNVLGNGNTANANINPDLTGNNRQLGSTSAIWNKIYVTNLSAGSNSSSGTIEGDWTLTSGSTLEATYADLAEIYETDIEYPTGTIVMFGGDKEVTAASEYATTKVAGVISNAYAFLMNKESSGQPIALKGRIPVRVIGDVNRGDFIVASDTPGVGVATDRFIGGAVIGKAITNKTADGEGLVECQV